MTIVMTLHIVSPEGTLVEAEVSAVTLPGAQAPFEVLPDHAPLISSLEKGEIVYVSEGEERRIAVVSGFVEVAANRIDVCAEV